MIDWTVNLGHILTIVILGAGGLGFVYTIRERVDAISNRMNTMEISIEKMVAILVTQGRQDERMNAIDGRLHAQGARIDEMSVRFNTLLDATINRAALG